MRKRSAISKFEGVDDARSLGASGGVERIQCLRRSEPYGVQARIKPFASRYSEAVLY
ncbi:MAG: hypothetical protein ETSY1_07550 [Candidatus Entotheonella factor]|uniref:Uncharacterized protein n=1 Tax=Entotheonella factor TaxID=1429438 RepID=W4LVL5_ENTF1|nr:MAG: hypothetical protein ETSY1_07550 [Candidatus Entotheonella factor]